MGMSGSDGRAYRIMQPLCTLQGHVCTPLDPDPPALRALHAAQDMVVQISGGGDVKFQRSYLEDLVRDLQAMRTRCEPILARLASYNTDEAAALMSRALEMMDTITNTVQLKDEVRRPAQSTPDQLEGSAGPRRMPAGCQQHVTCCGARLTQRVGYRLEGWSMAAVRQHASVSTAVDPASGAVHAKGLAVRPCSCQRQHASRSTAASPASGAAHAQVLSGKMSAPPGAPQLVVTRTAPPTPPESAPGRPPAGISSALDGIAELQQARLGCLCTSCCTGISRTCGWACHLTPGVLAPWSVPGRPVTGTSNPPGGIAELQQACLTSAERLHRA